MAIRSPGTIGILLKKAKKDYQKVPPNAKSDEEQLHYKIDQGLKRLKVIAKKEPDDQRKPFVDTKKGVLRNMKQYHKKLKANKKTDPNAQRLATFSAAYLKLTLAVSLLDYNTVEFAEQESVEESALDQPTQEQLKLLESDDDGAFDNQDGKPNQDSKPKTQPDNQALAEALKKKIKSREAYYADTIQKVDTKIASKLTQLFEAAKSAAEKGEVTNGEASLNSMLKLAGLALKAAENAQKQEVEKGDEDEEEEEDNAFFERLFDIDGDTLKERLRKLMAERQSVSTLLGRSFLANIFASKTSAPFLEIPQLASRKDFNAANQRCADLEKLMAEFRAKHAKDGFFRTAIGDKSQQRQAVNDRLDATLPNAKATMFARGDYDEMMIGLKQSKVDLGKSFKKVLKSLKLLEGDRDNRDLRIAMSKACLDYIKRVEEEYTPEQKRDPGTQAKLEVAQNALRRLKLLRLAEAREDIEKMPSRSEDDRLVKDERLFALMAETIIEESPQGAAKPLGAMEGAGVNGAYMVEHSDTGNNVLIFKPADAEEDLGGGWEKGSGAIREMAAKALSDSIKKSMGVDLGVAETHMVPVENRKLPNSKGKVVGEPRGLRLGSVQMLLENDGALRDLDAEDPEAFYATVPAEDIDKMAMMDLITLNQDRHGGNILVKKDQNGQNRLLPIDHGKSMPPLAAFLNGRGEMKSKNHLVSKAPQFNEPFSDDMIKQIELLKPEDVASDLTKARETTRKIHGGAVDMLSDESIMMSQRSMMLLKVAAPAKLSKAEINDLLIEHGAEIFQAPANTEDAVIARLVKEAVDNKQAKAVLELGDIPPDVAIKMLSDLGYYHSPTTGTGNLPADKKLAWFNENLRRMPAIVNGRIDNPVILRAITPKVQELRQANRLDFDPDSLPCGLRWERVRRAWTAMKKDKVQQNAGALGLNTITDNTAKDKRTATWEKYEQDDMDGVIPNAANLGPDQKLQAYLTQINGANNPTKLDKAAEAFSKLAAKTVDEQIAVINEWNALEQLGGIAEAKARGIPVNPNRADGLKTALAGLRDSKELEANSTASDGIDPVAARQAAAEKDLGRAAAIIAGIGDQQVKGQLDLRCKALQQEATTKPTGKPLKDLEQAATDLVLEAENQADAVNSSLAKIATQKNTTTVALNALPPTDPVRVDLSKRLEDADNLGIQGKIDPCLALLKSLENQAKLQKTKLDLEQERTQQGPNSRIAQMEARLQAAVVLAKSQPVDIIRNKWLVYCQDAKAALKVADLPGCDQALQTLTLEEALYVRNKVSHIKAKVMEVAQQLTKVKSKPLQKQLMDSCTEINQPLNSLSAGALTTGPALQKAYKGLQKLQAQVSTAVMEIVLDDSGPKDTDGEPMELDGKPMTWEDSFLKV